MLPIRWVAVLAGWASYVKAKRLLGEDAEQRRCCPLFCSGDTSPGRGDKRERRAIWQLSTARLIRQVFGQGSDGLKLFQLRKAPARPDILVTSRGLYSPSSIRKTAHDSAHVMAAFSRNGKEVSILASLDTSMRLLFVLALSVSSTKCLRRR